MEPSASRYISTTQLLHLRPRERCVRQEVGFREPRVCSKTVSPGRVRSYPHAVSLARLRKQNLSKHNTYTNRHVNAYGGAGA